MGQHDLYFRVPRGRLKLREWWLDGDQAQGGERAVARRREQWGQQDPGSGVRNRVREDGDVGPTGGVLIAYARPDDARSRFSDYPLSPVAESATMRAVLAHALCEMEASMSGHIPWNCVDRQLRALRSIWVSSTRPDGRPHAVPVWFTWDGRTLYFATHESSQKARNLERQAWLVIHAGDGDDVIILDVQRTATGQGGETM